MNKKEFKENDSKRYSSKAKRKMVEELRSGMLTIRQCAKQYQVSVRVLQDWNRWYYKTRLFHGKRIMSNCVSKIKMK